MMVTTLENEQAVTSRTEKKSKVISCIMAKLEMAKNTHLQRAKDNVYLLPFVNHTTLWLGLIYYAC